MGIDRNAGRYAVNTWCDPVDFSRTHRGNGVGALVGALLAAYFAENLLAFGGAVFAIGLLCAAVRMEKTAYRYASITLAIIVLIPRASAAWIVALHRFIEVSVGIVIALALVALWPEHDPESGKHDGA